MIVECVKFNYNQKLICHSIARFSNQMVVSLVNSVHVAKARAILNIHTTLPSLTQIESSFPIRTIIASKYSMWTDAFCRRLVQKVAKKDNLNFQGNACARRLTERLLRMHFNFSEFPQRCGCRWSRVHCCCRFGQQSCPNLPSGRQFSACIWLMGIGWCWIQGSWRRCHYVEWQYFSLRPRKPSCSSLLNALDTNPNSFNP